MDWIVNEANINNLLNQLKSLNEISFTKYLQLSSL